MEWYGISITLLGLGVVLIGYALASQGKTNADLQRQIDNLKCELEEIKKQTEPQS